jgi:hypothetical protein
MELIIFILIAYGITNVVVNSTLFLPIRILIVNNLPKFFGNIINCTMCFGTWCGFALSSILWMNQLSAVTPSGLLGITIPVLGIFLDGCLASGCVWVIDTIQEWFKYNTPEIEE